MFQLHRSGLQGIVRLRPGCAGSVLAGLTICTVGIRLAVPWGADTVALSIALGAGSTVCLTNWTVGIANAEICEGNTDAIFVAFGSLATVKAGLALLGHTGLLWSAITVNLADGILETAITVDAGLTIGTVCTALAGIGGKGDTGTGIADLTSTTVCTGSAPLEILIQRTVAR
ncbi:unnamed protein product [Clonostachys rhizophaga]|uniref:Uncharacterized protein n=1 Tax=Clonostachys rhizophaga TaxID=160324 RepID=A0A9N9YY20_9HYPO|nr:unnamed protein product [Clonostachys rhizophaga]